jgi:hypothetical protein
MAKGVKLNIRYQNQFENNGGFLQPKNSLIS